MNPIWRAYFSNGLVQQPTSWVIVITIVIHHVQWKPTIFPDSGFPKPYFPGFGGMLRSGPACWTLLRWSLATWNIVVDVILAIGVNGVIGAIVMCIAVVAWGTKRPRVPVVAVWEVTGFGADGLKNLQVWNGAPRLRELKHLSLSYRLIDWIYPLTQDSSGKWVFFLFFFGNLLLKK